MGAAKKEREQPNREKDDDDGADGSLH
jgi:hypothetical protein